jgi:hypothetical protein
MDLVLHRTAFKATGIYGEIEAKDTQKKLFFTLEHSYPVATVTDVNINEKTVTAETTGWEAKIPKGTYTCVRGQHQLHHGLPFETFMVTGVPGHEGILFHVGNYNRDSEGCILIGKEPIPDGVGKSGDAFREFIELQRGCDSFVLGVV